MKTRSLLLLTGWATLSWAPAHAAEPLDVAIVLYDGVEVLDFAGPAEVLEIAGAYGRSGEHAAFRLYTVASTRDPVTSQNFLNLIPDHTPATAPTPDVLVVPGGRMGSLLGDEAFMRWLDRAMAGAITLTVCSGAIAPAELGRLDGRTATTWHGLVDRLDSRFPEVDFQHGRRFVDSGPIVTTAGVSAGIDGSLHLVARLLGLRVASETARYMEYAWTPEPHLQASYPVLNPRLNPSARMAQIGRIQLRSGDLEGAEATWRRSLDREPENAELWYGLFQTLSEMGRWEEATEASLEIVASNPIRGYYNAACAAARSGHPQRALDYLRQAIEAGFHDRSTIEGDDDLAPLRDEPGFQALLDLAAQAE